MLQRVIGFSNHLFAPPLLHSQAARDAWSVSATHSPCGITPSVTAKPYSTGSIHCSHCPAVWLKAVSPVWNFPGRAFQNEIAANSVKILPAIHVLAAYSFLSFIHSSYLVVPAFVAFISFSTASKSGSFTHSVPVITGTPFPQSPPLPFPALPILTDKKTNTA